MILESCPFKGKDSMLQWEKSRRCKRCLNMNEFVRAWKILEN